MSETTENKSFVSQGHTLATPLKNPLAPPPMVKLPIFTAEFDEAYELQEGRLPQLSSVLDPASYQLKGRWAELGEITAAWVHDGEGRKVIQTFIHLRGAPRSDKPAQGR